MNDRELEPAVVDANPNQTPADDGLETPVPAPVDPGGAHAKGYSAEAGPNAPVPDADPVPVAGGPVGQILQPERDGEVAPTGRGEPGDYTPNDRLMGSDR